MSILTVHLYMLSTMLFYKHLKHELIKTNTDAVREILEMLEIKYTKQIFQCIFIITLYVYIVIILL